MSRVSKNESATSRKISSESSSELSQHTSALNVNTNVIYRPKDINPENIEVTDFKIDDSQDVAYVKYLDPTLSAKQNLIIQTGKIKLTGHGIPSLHERFYPTDDKREFLKIPLDPEQKSCTELRFLFEGIDKHFGSNEMKQKLFKKKANKYFYQSTVRSPKSNDDEEDEDNDDNGGKKSKKEDKNKSKGKYGKSYPKYDFIKVKLNFIREGDQRVNKTRLWKVSGDKKEQMFLRTMTEVANAIPFLSEIKMIFYVCKVWINKAPSPGTSHILYGVGLKALAIEYSPSIRGINADTIGFVPSDDDDASEPTDSNKKLKDGKSVVKSDKMKASKNEKNTKTPKLDDEDDDVVPEEEKSLPKNFIDEMNEEDEEDEIPIKKTKKSTKKKKPKVMDDDEEIVEDEEEESKPKKKPKMKTSSKSK